MVAKNAFRAIFPHKREATMKEIRIGISGWTYPPWRKVFFPQDLPQRRELEYASRQVNSIEINGTFYSLQRPSSFRAWYDATPEDFVFSLKGGRYITHITRLKEPKKPLANFFASGVLALGKKLGPFLWQLPPNFQYDRERLKISSNTYRAIPLKRRNWRAPTTTRKMGSGKMGSGCKT